jgi:hypothetical protein
LIKYLLHILAVALIVFSFVSCEDEKYFTSPDAMLQFSKDTITFDTIFTSIGSTTQHFTVINPYDENILISRIRLANAINSSFKLNVDGIAANEVYEVEVPAKDSIFIFVEVTINPSGQNLPMVVEDSIEFTTNSNIQNISLIAYGQDFKLIKGENIKTTTWTSEKPYLIYDYVQVDSTSTLTIEPGTKIYFHKDAGMYVKGTVNANGTFEKPISFLPDRLEDAYENIPDQWNGIVLFSGSHNNIFNFTTIKNANIGLQVGNIENEGFASVRLTNSRIENMAYAGLFALKSKIYAYNDVIANCGFYAVALLVGGEYEFYHTTIANYWGYSSRKTRSTASLVISNVLKVSNTNGGSDLLVNDLVKATFGNCIVYGNNITEIELAKNTDKEFNYFFDHCILKLPETFNTSNKNNYNKVWKGINYDPLFIDPYEKFNYSLDSLSPAKDIGSFEYARTIQSDILKNDRFSDDGPDLGAYERFTKKNK